MSRHAHLRSDVRRSALIRIVLPLLAVAAYLAIMATPFGVDARSEERMQHVVRRESHAWAPRDYTGTTGIEGSGSSNGGTSSFSTLSRDKWIGLGLAISSSLAIGTSFIITKKVGGGWLALGSVPFDI